MDDKTDFDIAHQSGDTRSGITNNEERVETRTYVDEPIVGWHWYNEPQPEEDEESPEPEQIPLSTLSPTVQKR